MSDPVPSSTSVLVIGAGVHGLSTAWHLAQRGEQVLVLDKTAVAAGASGIACGVIRNNYFQPAMSELMAACPEVCSGRSGGAPLSRHWLHRARPPAQEGDLAEVFERQQRIGYPSELHLGDERVASHKRSLYLIGAPSTRLVCPHR